MSIDSSVVPVDEEWHFVNLTDWLLSVAEGRSIEKISFFRASERNSDWALDDVYLIVKESEEEIYDEGQTTPIPPIPQPQPPVQGEGGGWIQQIYKSAKQIVERLLGNPLILLLLIILIIIMAYYTTKRR